MPVETESEEKVVSLPRVGKQAPYFKAGSNGLAFSLDDFRGRWLVLFSQPSDCTPTDASELIESIEIYPRLKKLGLAVLGLSVADSASDMLRLVDLPEDMGVQTPLLIKGAVSRDVALAYGRIWLVKERNPGRCVYIINGELTVKAILYYPLPTKGRMNEVLKILAGLNTTFNMVVSPDIWNCDSSG